eukprot:s8173_g2.t1
MAPDDDVQELIASSEVHYVGTRLRSEVYLHQEQESAGCPEEFWHQDEDGAFSFWELGEDGEYYSQDMNGLFWAWSDWEDGILAATTSPEPSKPNEENYSASSDAKSRSFTQARQAVKAKNLSRGFYPFNPSIKGRPRFKGKGKGRGRGKSSGFRPATSPVLSATGDVFAQPGDPAFTECFVCGAKDHSWRACPKRSPGEKGAGKGKPGRSFIAENIFVIQDFEIDPSEELGYPCDAEDDSKSARIEMQRSPILDLRDELSFHWDCQDSATGVISSFVVTSQADAFASNTPDSHPRGHAVVDSGATETVGSLPAIEDLMQYRNSEMCMLIWESSH